MAEQKPNINMSANKSNTVRSVIFMFLVLCLVTLFVMNMNNGETGKKTEVAISDVISRANDPEGNIAKITVTGDKLDITLKGKDVATETSRKDPSGTLYDQGLINYCDKLEGDELSKCQEKYPVIEYKEDINAWGIILDVALTVLPIIAVVIFLSWMMRQATAANNQSMSFGKARAQLYGPDKKKVTFNDVAGNEAAKQDLTEIVDFLKNPKKYEKLGAKIQGIHLEGPFINPRYKGIHPENFILKPTLENLKKIKELDFVKLITYAFELDENLEFTNELKRRSIIGSVGHSGCDYNMAQKAFSLGRDQITHLYNALKQPHHREPALINSALINDDIFVEIICDFLHLHKGTVELVLKIKPENKVILISDALPCAYSKKEKTVFGGEEIFIKNNIASSKDGTIAGSTFFLDKMLKNIGFENYINCATKNVANSLNLSNIGEIATNKTADLVLWNKDFDVIFNMINGEIVYKP